MLVVVEWVPRFLSTPIPHHPPPPPPPHVDNKFVIPYSLFFNYYYASMIALKISIIFKPKFFSLVTLVQLLQYFGRSLSSSSIFDPHHDHESVSTP